MERLPRNHTASRIGRFLVRSHRPAIDRYLAATLRESFGEPGCPLCRLLEGKERRALEAILWEQVNDPATADRLAAARGFCWEHSWALVPAGAAVHSHLGVAILLERLLRLAFRSGPARNGLAGWLRPVAPCPVCEWLGQAEKTLLSATTQLVQQDPSLVYRQPGLLCRPHATALAELLSDFPWTAWHERVEHERVSWSSLELLQHDVGRRPWYVPRPAALPAVCPHCLAEQPGHDRRWSWLRAFWQPPLADCSLEVCLGHAAASDHAVPWYEELTALLDDVTAFIAAHDYRFRGTLDVAQRGSWLRAIARLVGTVPAAGPHERTQCMTV